MKMAKIILLLAAFGPAAALAQPPNIPVAPVPACGFMGWTNAFRLKNAQVEAVIIPETGRMIHFGPAGGENLLRLDESLAGKSYPRKNGGDWKNFGGQWMWPAAQAVWPSFQTNNWPPSAMIDRKPWSGYAWAEADGSLACSITRHFGEPLNVEARQVYRLMPSNSFVTIRQSLVRTGPSSVPVTIWNLVQVPQPKRIAFSADKGKGWQTLMFTPPPPERIQLCGRFWVYEPGEGEETKIGSRSPVAHMAAFSGSHAVMMKASPNGNSPADEVFTEIYVNTGLGYAELEALSGEKNLKEDESLSFTVQVHVLDNVPQTSDPCEQTANMEARTP